MLAARLRDRIQRQLSAHYEPTRTALRYITHNEQIPFQDRMKAQIALNSFPRYMRPTSVVNRCIETGRARGVLRAARLSRSNFREKALMGLLPGFKRAVW